MWSSWALLQPLVYPATVSLLLLLTLENSLTLVLPRSPIGDRSAPRARDSRHEVVCTRPQAQIVGWVFSSRP